MEQAEVFVTQVDHSRDGTGLWQDYFASRDQDRALEVNFVKTTEDYPDRPVRLIGRVITERIIATNSY